MIQLSSAYRAALESGAEQNIRLVFDNGETLDRAQISATGGFRYRQILNDDGDVIMGRAIQSAAEVELLNIDGYLDDFDFDSEFTVEYGVKVGALFQYVTIGKFKGGRASRIKSKTIMLTGADRMRLFDIDASEFIENVQDSFPMDVMDLLQKLCDYVGIEMEYFSLASSVLYRTIDTNPFTSYNHTCRQILEWLMECMCKYAVITPDGKLTGIFYQESDITVPKSRRFEMAQSEYITPQIDAIEIYTSYSDRLVSSGDGDNLYVISDNPFLYAENDEDVEYDLQYAANGLLTALRQLPAYPPASFRALTDPSIECGDIIDVVGDDGLTYTFPVMMRTIEWSGIGKSEYECTGNERRETVPVAQRELENLKKDMVRTSQLATEIESYIKSDEGKAGIIASVSGSFVKPDDLRQYVTTAKLSQEISSIDAKISLEAEYGSGTIGSNVRAMLTLFANADSSNIQLKADAIDLSGYVTVTALSGQGTTVIDGSNIKTGTITSDKLNVGTLSAGEVLLKSETRDTTVLTSSESGMNLTVYLGTQEKYTSGDIDFSQYVRVYGTQTMFVPPGAEDTNTNALVVNTDARRMFPATPGRWSLGGALDSGGTLYYFGEVVSEFFVFSDDSYLRIYNGRLAYYDSEGTRTYLT